jgi:hypothetical protein
VTWLWLIVPVLVLAALAGLAAMWVHLGRDGGQHAAPRAPVLRAPSAGPARHRTVQRAQTAGQPPAELTDTPCTEPPATDSFPAIPASHS